MKMKLKICGMKYAGNIREVAALSPDFMGFIFYPQSKRFVGNDFEMPEIPASIKKVGVFVNESRENILDKATKHKLDYVQLHGDESAGFCGELFQSLKLWKSFTMIIKAFGTHEDFDFSLLKEYENNCEYFLFDTKTKEYGGSGKSFDWTILKNYRASKPYFLSGGIGLEEFSSPKSKVPSAFALDVNSKFEIEPGLKDIEKLKILITSLRETK
jgi:phosphoribosylanthranilate isomerase